MGQPVTMRTLRVSAIRRCVERARRRGLHLQRRFAETPFEIPIAAYFGVIGFIGLASGTGITPTTLDATLPIWLVQAWTAGLAVGGLLTVISRVRHTESDRLESAGLILLGYGSTLYAVVLLSAAFPASVFAAAAMIAIATGCGVRLGVLVRSQRSRSIAADIRGVGEL